jgi:hypothetical protein
MGRMGDVSDIVDAVLYLDGAGFVTGEVLHVDGGQAAGHHLLWSKGRIVGAKLPTNRLEHDRRIVRSSEI